MFFPFCWDHAVGFMDGPKNGIYGYWFKAPWARLMNIWHVGVSWIGVPKNGWVKMELPLKMDDLEVPPTPMLFFFSNKMRWINWQHGWLQGPRKQPWTKTWETDRTGEALGSWLKYGEMIHGIYPTELGHQTQIWAVCMAHFGHRACFYRIAYVFSSITQLYRPTET